MKFQKPLLIILVLFLTYSAFAQEQIRFGPPIQAEDSKNLLPLSSSEPPQELATDAEVILISGYEPANKNKTGTIVNVEVNRPGSKVILVLSSFEKIDWKVSATPSTTISGIVTLGNKNSVITTAIPTQGYLVKLPYAYETKDENFKKLLITLNSWFGINKLDVFRVSYTIPTNINISTLDPLIFANVGDVQARIVKQKKAQLLKSAKNRLKSCDPSIAVDAAEEIVNDPDTLKEPLELFGPAAVLFQHGKKDEAVFWFTAAELRVKYQLAFEKGDIGQLLTVMRMVTGPPILNYAFQDISNYCRILDRVLEWDKKAPNPFREKPRSESINKEIENIYIGLRDYKIKLVAEKSDLEAKARKAAPSIEKTYTKDNTLCRKGQLDPAYAEQETEKEWSLVIDFVKNNKKVIKDTGGIKEIYPASHRQDPKEVMPNRYEVSVHGNDGKTIFAIVNISREEGKAKFSLACTTSLSIGYRDPFKDVCEQAK